MSPAQLWQQQRLCEVTNLIKQQQSVPCKIVIFVDQHRSQGGEWEANMSHKEG